MWNRYALNSTVNTLATGTYHIHCFFCWHHSCSGLLSILPGQSEHCIYRKSQLPNGPSQEKYSVAIHFSFGRFGSSGLNRCQNRTYGEKWTWRSGLLLFLFTSWTTSRPDLSGARESHVQLLEIVNTAFYELVLGLSTLYCLRGVNWKKSTNSNYPFTLITTYIISV